MCVDIAVLCVQLGGPVDRTPRSLGKQQRFRREVSQNDWVASESETVTRWGHHDAHTNKPRFRSRGP